MSAKIPGISEKRMRAMIATVKADIVELATDAYNGANWVADWRVTGLDEYGEPNRMEFVRASGESDEHRQTHWALRARGQTTPETIEESGKAAARAVSGTWDAEVELGWLRLWMDNGLTMGSIHHEYDGAFYRYGNLHGVEASVKVPIRIKVRAWYRKTDQAIAFQWSWKGGAS